MIQKMKIALLLTSSSSLLFTTRISAFSVNINNSISRSGNNALYWRNPNERSRWTIFGGDYAGHSATFSSIDGTLIKVPDHLVPDSMVEWGQVPSCLDCIVSEDLLQDDNDDDDSKEGNDDRRRRFILERNTVSVLPEVGCGLDNLDTTNVMERIPFDHYVEFDLGDVTVSTVLVEETNRHVECVFMTKTSVDKKNKVVERTRVRVNLQEKNQLAKSSPIVVTKERQTSKESSRGTIAKGGGLDARTVTTLIGKELTNKPFSERKALDLVSLEGKWMSPLSPHNGDFAAERGDNFWNGALSLCGNIIVRYSTSPYPLLEISLILDSDTGFRMKRVVVNRILPEVENFNYAGGNVQCFEDWNTSDFVK